MLVAREITTQGMTDAQIDVLARIYYGGPNRLPNLAPHIVGLWLDAILSGIMLYLFIRWQVKVAPTDKRWTKVLVYYICILCAGTTAHVYAFQSHMFVEGFGYYRMLVSHTWARFSFVFHALLRVPCSLFFTHRAWMMYKRHWAIPTFIVPMVLIAGGCSLCITAFYQWIPLPIMARRFVWAMASFELAADAALTTLLSIALLRSKTGWKQTDRLIGRILTLTIETQTPPTLCSVVFIIVTAKWADTSMVAYFQGIPQVFPICLMVVISSRLDLNRSAGTGLSHRSTSDRYTFSAQAAAHKQDLATSHALATMEQGVSIHAHASGGNDLHLQPASAVVPDSPLRKSTFSKSVTAA